MKYLNYYLFSIPCFYAGFAYYKSASLADALIIACFCAIVGLFSYLDKKFPNNIQELSELDQLEKDLKIERAKLAIEQVKTAAVNDKAARDARAAVFGQDGGSKTIRF